jgi:hypothetical protein
MWTLRKANGAEPVKGETLTTFRGEQYQYAGGQPPQHSGSTGRIYVTLPEDEGRYEAAYFPQVFNCKWEFSGI